MCAFQEHCLAGLSVKTEVDLAVLKQPLCQQMRQGPESCASDNIMCKRMCCKKCWCFGISASLWEQTISELIKKNVKTYVLFSVIVYWFQKYSPSPKAAHGFPSASASSLVCCPGSAECVFSCLCSLCADLFHNSSSSSPKCIWCWALPFLFETLINSTPLPGLVSNPSSASYCLGKCIRCLISLVLLWKTCEYW